MSLPGISVDDGTVHVNSARGLQVVGGSAADLGDGVVKLTIPILSGTAAPNAGAGVAHPFPCLYLRANGSTGELWLSTGAGATQWTQVTVP